MACKHKENGICGKDGPCLSPYCEEKVTSNTQPKALHLADAYEATGLRGHLDTAIELRRLHQSETEAWRYADELEQERKKHKLQVLQLIDVIEDLIHLGKWKPEWEDARDLIKEIREKNNE